MLHILSYRIKKERKESTEKGECTFRKGKLSAVIHMGIQVKRPVYMKSYSLENAGRGGGKGKPRNQESPKGNQSCIDYRKQDKGKLRSPFLSLHLNRIMICVAIYAGIRIDVDIFFRICLCTPLPETLQKHGEEKNDSKKGRKNHRCRFKAVAEKEQEAALQSLSF